MYKSSYLCLLLCLSLFLSLNILKFTLPLGQEGNEFLYLANIVETQTMGKSTQIEQVKALTDWLAENVKAANPYPPWFDGSSVARVMERHIQNISLGCRSLFYR